MPNKHTLKIITWSEEKNRWLKINRSISFEEIVYYLSEDDNLLDVIESKKYPKQKNFILNINDYVYVVPFVEDKEKIFLKTIFPSRKATKYYLTN